TATFQPVMRPPSTSAVACVTAASRMPEIVTDAREIASATASSIDPVDVPVSSTTFSTIPASFPSPRPASVASVRLGLREGTSVAGLGELRREALAALDLPRVTAALRFGDRLRGEATRVPVAPDDVIRFGELEAFADRFVI